MQKKIYIHTSTPSAISPLKRTTSTDRIEHESKSGGGRRIGSCGSAVPPPVARVCCSCGHHANAFTAHLMLSTDRIEHESK